MGITIGMAITMHKKKIEGAINHLKLVDKAGTAIFDIVKEYIEYYSFKINPVQEIPIRFDPSAKQLSLWETVLTFSLSYTPEDHELSHRLALGYTIASSGEQKYTDIFAGYYEEEDVWKIRSSKEDLPLSIKDGFETQICLILSQFVEEAVNHHVAVYHP